MPKDKSSQVRFHGSHLTAKQLHVMQHLAHGLGNEEIAENMHISPRTVESHVAKIRTILSEPSGRRINDRALALLAKELYDALHLFRSRNT